MNVLIASHLFPNVTSPVKGVFVGELARALQSKVTLKVVAPVSQFPVLRSRKDIPTQTRFHGIPVYHPSYLALPGSLLNHRWKPYCRAIEHCFAKYDLSPEVIHAHWLYPDAYAVARFAKPNGIKTVVTIHGHAALGKGMIGVPTALQRKALHDVDHIITVSSELKKIITTEFDVPDEKVSLIHNGFDPNVFPHRPQQKARARLGIDAKRPTLLSVARLSPEKRLDLLIEAVSRCSVPGLQTFIIGEGPLRRTLQNQIDHTEHSESIRLVGGVAHEKLADWFYAADLFCLTSAHEGCPVVIHEAQGCGLPVVSTRVGAVPDLINSPVLGYLGNHDAGEIASLLDKAVMQEWKAETIRVEGSKHTWTSVADRTIECFTSVLD